MIYVAFSFPSVDWSQWPDWLTNCANLASILTAAVAAWAWWSFGLDARKKKEKLERYLKDQKDKAKNLRDDKGQKSLLHLVANVGLTEAEILHASFQSPYIKRTTRGSEDSPLASAILFEYDPSGTSE